MSPVRAKTAKQGIRPGWEPKALNKTSISGQQRRQEQRVIWVGGGGGEKGSPLDGQRQGKASQELCFRKSFLVFLLVMGELLPWSHGSSCVGNQFVTSLMAKVKAY